MKWERSCRRYESLNEESKQILATRPVWKGMTMEFVERKTCFMKPFTRVHLVVDDVNTAAPPSRSSALRHTKWPWVCFGWLGNQTLITANCLHKLRWRPQCTDPGNAVELKNMNIENSDMNFVYIQKWCFNPSKKILSWYWK